MNSSDKSAHTYKGKPLQDCTKAELIVAVMELGRLLQKAYQDNSRQTRNFAKIMGIIPDESSKR